MLGDKKVAFLFWFVGFRLWHLTSFTTFFSTRTWSRMNYPIQSRFGILLGPTVLHTIGNDGVMHARYCGCGCDFVEIFCLCEGDLLTIINCHHLRTLCPIKPCMHTYIASYACFVVIWHHHHRHPIPIFAYVMNTLSLFFFFFLISFFGQTQVVTQLWLFWPTGGFSNIFGQFLTSYPPSKTKVTLHGKKIYKKEGVTLSTIRVC